MQKQEKSLELTYKKDHPFKTLVHLFDHDRGKMGLSLLFFAIKHSPVWILPIIIAHVISIISEPEKHALTELWVSGGIFLVLILQNIPTHITFTYFFSKAVHNMQSNLRGALIRRLQELSISVHNEFHSGKLQAKVLRDVETIIGLVRHLVNSVFPALLGTIVALAVTLYKDPLFALVYLLTAPVAVVLMRVFMKRMNTSNQEYRQEIEIMSMKVSEMIEMIPVTRAHGAEHVELKKVMKQLQNVTKRGVELDVVGGVFAASTWVSFQAFQLFCILAASYMAYKKMMSVGDVVLYQTYFTTIVSSINQLLSVYPELSRGFESIKSIGEVIECPDIELNAGKRVVKQVQGNFRFDNVSFKYESIRNKAVCNFSLDVNQGESIAIVGESGSGKTTLINLIIGFRRPTEGRILLDGSDMQDLDLRYFRRYLSVVSQNTILFSGSIKDNITYGLDNVKEEQIIQALSLANAMEFVEKLPQGIDTPIGEHGAKLSGGQRQRIAIARAVIRDPKIIILDEATSALDVISESLVQDAISKMIKGRTTFIVAHRLSTIRHADRIIVMKDGQCIETGTHEELLQSKGEFFKLKSLQV